AVDTALFATPVAAGGADLDVPPSGVEPTTLSIPLTVAAAEPPSVLVTDLAGAPTGGGLGALTVGSPRGGWASWTGALDDGGGGVAPRCSGAGSAAGETAWDKGETWA